MGHWIGVSDDRLNSCSSFKWRYKVTGLPSVTACLWLEACDVFVFFSFKNIQWIVKYPLLHGFCWRLIQSRMATCWEGLSKASVSSQRRSELLQRNGTLELDLRFIPLMNFIVDPHRCLLLQHRRCFSNRFTTKSLQRASYFKKFCLTYWKIHNFVSFSNCSMNSHLLNIRLQPAAC